jgi:hypothetical protein
MLKITVAINTKSHFVACGLWLVACGLWLVACGLWLVACGLWLVACGLWLVAKCSLFHCYYIKMVKNRNFISKVF